MEIKMRLSVAFVSYFLISLFDLVRCFDNDLTVMIQPSSTECFFVPVKKETDIEVEFQVLDGGDLDINFYATDPMQRMLAAQMKKSEATHKFNAKELGDYRICFDNSISRFSRKLVYFEIILTEDDAHEDAKTPPNFDDMNEADVMKELVDVTFDEFKVVVTKVHANLDRSIQYQSIIKHFEARDRNIQEANFERVNNWSLLQIAIMVSVALVQVLTIRSLFQTQKTNIKAQT